MTDGLYAAPLQVPTQTYIDVDNPSPVPYGERLSAPAPLCGASRYGPRGEGYSSIRVIGGYLRRPMGAW